MKFPEKYRVMAGDDGGLYHTYLLKAAKCASLPLMAWDGSMFQYR